MSDAASFTRPPAGAQPGDDRATVADSLDLLGGALDRLRAAAERGEPVELSGLDREVECLCAAALALPPPDARAMLPRLMGLVDGLDRLVESLRRQAAGQPPSVRQRALRAYGQPVPLGDRDPPAE